ncbi:MAG: xanthine dehydrogenase accessory protein XdhC [Cypionkella sp.]|nr:xanthine dehydrogenase accessory protein XdhC [Cypionkella sp.]
MFDSNALTEAIAAHGPVARVVVASVQGSAPRDVGAAMLVWADTYQGGGQSGTIGGGALEFQAVQIARRMLETGIGVRLDTIPLGPNLGQCCGGAVQLVTEVFTAAPNEKAAFARAVRAGTKEMPLSIARALAQARQGQMIAPALQHGWLVEPLTSARAPVWIWGAGHVGRALVSVMAPLPDVQITWLDTDLARFPDDIASGVRAMPAPDLARAVALAPTDAHHVILTFSHALDLALCDGLLRRGFASLGLIGSATKWARFRGRLAALGHAPAAISRITCPIGTPAFGKHPQAIAIGVAAAMMQGLTAAPQIKQEARA